jgi:hypothetical protein
MIGYGITKGDAVFAAVVVVLLLTVWQVALALVILWTIAFVARRRWKN